jgi:hypothetical protein
VRGALRQLRDDVPPRRGARPIDRSRDPQGTTITWSPSSGGGSSCTQFHGYHGELPPLASGVKVPLAVLARCPTLPEVHVTGIQYVAAIASHEVLEGLADPFPNSNPAYLAVDDAHSGWGATGAEIGDLCALQGNAFYQPADFPYTVQKVWSNAAAKARKDPCVPEKDGEPYFVAGMKLDNYGTVKIAVGKEATIPIVVYADAPMSAEVTLDAHEYPGHGDLTATFDKTTAKVGDTVTLTIKSLAVSPQGQEAFAVGATVGKRTNLFFGIVSH